MRIFLRAILGILGMAVVSYLVAEPSDSVAQTPSKGTARDPMTVAEEIDRLIDARLTEGKLPASPVADDAEFLRRATLDLCGRIPSAEKVAAFLADSDPNKRKRAINELLADREYGEHFAIIWYHRMVRPDDDNRFLISRKLQDWLADRFNENAGWDQIVKDILTASGDRDEHPETVFWLANVSDKKGQPQPSKITGAASRLFLGVRLECAECHNHPFTRLKQEDFWGVAAFFTNTHGENSNKKAAKAGTSPTISEGGNVRVKGGKKKNKGMEKAPFGSITIPDSKGKTVQATVLGEKPVPLAGKQALRPLFAAWVTSPKNPYFARAAVNKLWANFFGRGIVDPVDDMRPEAKATHPEILQLLANEFTASGYDLKHLARCIVNSKAYQRTSRALPTNKDDDQLYSHMRVKVMTADMLFDSLGVALGHSAAEKDAVKGKGKKKAQQRKRAGTVRDQFRKFFHAEVDDDVGVAEDYTHGIPQALRLMNARQINDTSGAVTQAMKAGESPEKIIDLLYLRVLSRRPTDAEIKRMKEYAAGDKDQTRAYGDIMWVLLNSGEFLLNH